MSRSRPRLRASIAGVVVALVLAAAAVVLLVPTGGPTTESRAYATHRLVRSSILQRCVEVTARGTLVGTRTERIGVVRWSGVRLTDPTITAVSRALVDGRCTASKPLPMRADLRQSWAVGSETPAVRSATVGPAAAVLSQFNSGAPVRFEPTILNRITSGGTAFVAHGVVTVAAHVGGTQDGVILPVEVALR